MCNPDGVIHGNTRTNLAGYDINRKWYDDVTSKEAAEVIIISNYLRTLQDKHEIVYLIDLHGHSLKYNSFCYYSTSQQFASTFSYEMSQKLPYFRFSDCTFDQNSVPLNTLRTFAKN